MKKLILLAVLLFSIVLTAQTQKQSFRDFTKAQITEREITQEWIALDSRIFFFYGNNDKVVKVYIGNLIQTYTIDSFREGVTEGGFEYLALNLLSAENEAVIMQIFKQTAYGIRVFFNEGNYVQIVD
jgi:hypothetical protein